jgi:hypothetical protein
MGLGTFTPKTEKVTIPSGGEFAVRGLAPEDFVVLLRNHRETMTQLFEKYVAEAAMVALAEDEADSGVVQMLASRGVQDLIFEALERVPALAGDIISRAADETENPHLARLLPTGVQLDSLDKIVRLTLESEGGLEKLLETVSRLTTSLAGLTVDRSR